MDRRGSQADFRHRRRAMETTLYQRLDPLLAGWAYQRGDKCVPLRLDFCKGRQARDINQPLDIRDRLLVERSNPHCERIDEAIELGVRERAINVAVRFGEVAMDVVGTEQNFQCPASAQQPWQSGHRASAWHQPRANLPLGQYRLLAACEAHIACQSKLASDPGCAPPN